MKSVEEYFSLHYDLKNEMIRLIKLLSYGI